VRAKIEKSDVMKYLGSQVFIARAGVSGGTVPETVPSKFPRIPCPSRNGDGQQFKFSWIPRCPLGLSA
jgi:hypothetical protein